MHEDPQNTCGRGRLLLPFTLVSTLLQKASQIRPTPRFVSVRGDLRFGRGSDLSEITKKPAALLIFVLWAEASSLATWVYGGTCKWVRAIFPPPLPFVSPFGLLAAARPGAAFTLRADRHGSRRRWQGPDGRHGTAHGIAWPWHGHCYPTMSPVCVLASRCGSSARGPRGSSVVGPSWHGYLGVHRRGISYG